MGLRIVWKSQCIWNRALHSHGVAHASLKKIKALRLVTLCQWDSALNLHR